MSLGDHTLLKSATIAKNFALRTVAMMKAHLHFLEAFMTPEDFITLKRELEGAEENVKAFDIQENLNELESVIPHRKD